MAYEVLEYEVLVEQVEVEPKTEVEVPDPVVVL